MHYRESITNVQQKLNHLLEKYRQIPNFCYYDKLFFVVIYINYTYGQAKPRGNAQRINSLSSLQVAAAFLPLSAPKVFVGFCINPLILIFAPEVHNTCSINLLLYFKFGELANYLFALSGIIKFCIISASKHRVYNSDHPYLANQTKFSNIKH